MADEQRREPRIPVNLGVKLAYGSVDDFIERFAVNVSRGGVFIRTRDPKPTGTLVRLAISLATGEQVIRAQGVVRWTSSPPALGEPSRVPGMGIQFTELDAASRGLVELIVSMRGVEGESSEAPKPPGVVANEAPPAATPERAAPAAAPLPAKPARAPEVIARSRLAIGIDLGTTNSCVAVAEGGKARVLVSKQGYRTFPSVVAYDEHGRLLIGHPAKAQMVINPKNTVYGSKRLIGRRFDSPAVQACRDRFHYDIVGGQAGEVAVRIAGRDYSLQQIAAFILKEMREVAVGALGEDVNRAVITVPAYYNDNQRQAVRDAGALAGLTVERIVNEPTAAALAFGHGKGLDQRILVYDLGGGTFDASILEIQGDVYEVVATNGDTFLGGVDFDDQIVDFLVQQFADRHGFLPPEDRVVWQRIRDAGEELKIALSQRERAAVELPYLCKDASGAQVDFRPELTRAELISLTGRLVDRSLQVCREALAARRLKAADIHEVLLVGGQSRMPLVWEKIRAELGREPNKGVHPDEAVALGAALLADSRHRIDSVVLIDALAMTIGIGLPGGRLAPVLPANTKLPAKKSYEIATSRDGQTELEVAVFQGSSAKVSECEYLGTVRVPGLAARPRGEVRVAIEFALGAEAILCVTARNVTTGQATEARLATIDTPASLREKLQIPAEEAPPKGAQPHPGTPGGKTPAAPAPSSEEPAPKKGLLGRLFGRR